MKVCVIQPEYSTDYKRIDELFNRELDFLSACTPDMDLIVMPESCDVPALPPDEKERERANDKYMPIILEKAKETAVRCDAVVIVNGVVRTEHGRRNTTVVIDRNGNVAGHYYKKHLVPSEVTKFKYDSDYTFEFSTPTIMEIDGIRYGFLTCYDFYFYEAFANIARYNPDVIIGCSHQRSDTNLALQIFSQTCAYNCNAYVVRSSVSMGENSNIGGGSMVVAPTGEVLANLCSRVGMETVEIDPKKRYLKPMGFGNPDGCHHEYIEKGRRAWQYRPAGSAIVKYDALMPYPRVCAHRGFSALLPENSMPAFGAAVAMGAQEIEFDLWPTKDGEIVSCHDSTLDRVSSGTGKIFDYTLEELNNLDFGIKFSEKLKGLKIVRFEEILKKFSCHIIMNIHIKPLSEAGEYPEDIAKKIVSLIKKYDCEKYVYFMLKTDMQIKMFKKIAPHIPICVGHLDARPWDIVDRAIEFGAQKVQFFVPYVNKEMIDKAHQNGIICNLFYADTEKEAKEYLSMGIDTILTNECGIISADKF